MTALRRLSPAWIWLLVAAALALRLAAPPGWMPVADSGGIRVALCTSSGIKTILLDTGVPASGGTEARDPCPFGLAGASALALPPVPDLPLGPALLALLLVPILLAARLTARRALRPPARGPPAFA
jgi:hypothetical protein